MPASRRPVPGPGEMRGAGAEDRVISLRSIPRRPLAAEERELVKRLRRGEEAAYDEFADAYLPGLYRFAAPRLRHDRELTRDIVQATVCKVIEKLGTFRGEAPLFTWLCACCRNEIAGHFRSQGRRPLDLGYEEDAGRPAAPMWGEAPADPEGELLEGEVRERVHLALDHLPSHYARALEWKYLHGLPVKEIAERLEVGAKAAESILTRARKAFGITYEDLERGALVSEGPVEA